MQFEIKTLEFRKHKMNKDCAVFTISTDKGEGEVFEYSTNGFCGEQIDKEQKALLLDGDNNKVLNSLFDSNTCIPFDQIYNALDEKFREIFLPF